MGYSARYHVASLAAVFLALAVGILIGAGFGDDLVRSSTENLESSLKGDLADARARSADLERDLSRERDFAEAAFPALVAGQLRGDRVAVVVFGGLDDQLGDDIREALEPSGARITEVAIVGEPPDRSGLLAAAGDHFQRRLEGTDRLAALAKRAGRDLVFGGPFYERVQDRLLTRFSGNVDFVDGVVVVRARPDGLNPRDEAVTARIEDGMIAGMADTGAPVLGVQRTDAAESSVGYFESRDLSTVDDMDLVAGKVAAVYALAGAKGNYGIGQNADALLPETLGRRPGAAIP